jgi:hypothetical protein
MGQLVEVLATGEDFPSQPLVPPLKHIYIISIGELRGVTRLWPERAAARFGLKRTSLVYRRRN